MAKQRFSRGRRNRFASVPTYDYGPGGGINTDFGAIASDVATDYEKRIEVADEAQERIDTFQKEATESQDYPHTGVADIDQSTINIANQAKQGILDARNRIGTQFKDANGVTRMYTIDDFATYKNNLINGSKIWSGQAKLVETTMDNYSKNDKLSGITTEGFINGIGGTQSKDKSYNVGIDEFGNFKLKVQDADGNETFTDYKQTAINGVEEINRFNSTEDISEFQKVYANTKKTFQIDGQQYSAEQVLSNPVLFTQHVTEQSDDFEAAKNQYIENFKNDKQKVISYAYDNMGVKLGGFDEEGNLIDQNTIGVDSRGRFVIGTEVQKKAAERFTAEVNGAFGSKEEGKAQIMRQKPVVNRKRDTSFDNMTVGGNSSQTFSTDTNFRLKTVGADGSTRTAQFGFQDVAYNLFMKTSGMEADPEASAANLMEKSAKTSRAAGEPIFSRETLDVVAADNEFKSQNTDFFDNTGAVRNRLYSDSEAVKVGSVELEKSIQRGDIDIESMSVGVDMSASDMEELGLTGVNGSPLTSISGIAFTYERYKADVKESEDPTADGTIEELNRKYPKRAVGIRIIGNGNISTTKKLSEGSPQLFGAEEVGATGTQKNTKKTAQLTSGLIQDNQIPQIVTYMSKNTPGFERLFNERLNIPGVSRAQAFYSALQQIKNIKSNS